jgi:hypothetical protein
MGIILCPGLINAEAAWAFGQALQSLCSQSAEDRLPDVKQMVILPQDCPTYSPKHILNFLGPHLNAQRKSWHWIAYSAGVVGGLEAARLVNSQHPVQGFFALDAWGVSLEAPFPVYHLSHDWLTHWATTLMNSRLAGTFYAQPSVSHLDLWGSPQTITGWDHDGNRASTLTTVAAFIAHRIFP